MAADLFGMRPLSVFGSVRRFLQTESAPVAVDHIAVCIALTKAIGRTRGPLQAANHGDHIDASARKLLVFIIVAGGCPMPVRG
ncbi:MAG TPA: hypothetical protein VLT88_02695, partial [Desulfosarcina sp.]|nr:hypothetical protein [Desulfosarcina sp.]